MKVRRLQTMVLAALLGAAVGCSRGNGQESEKPIQEPKAVSDFEKSAADSINRFGFRLLPVLAKQEGKNVFVSAASISTALAMTWNGTGGETAAEMAKALELNPGDKDSVNRGFQDLIAGLGQNDPKVQVSVANALWLGREPNPDFARTAQAFYAAEASHVDFGNPEKAVGRINAWVKEKTREKIDRILSAQDVGPATDIVLTNAIYFKGTWTTQFDPKVTIDGDFMLADGSRKRLPMMRGQKMPAKSFGTEQFQAVGLPYGSGRFRLYLFVPGSDGLKGFLGSLTAEKWQEWMGKFRDDQTSVIMPRFKVEFEESLVKPMKSLGMNLAFGGGDLAPMGFPGSFISEIKHKAVMEVNEEGTVAAAASAVAATRSAAMPFTVNRPFFAAIRDERTGLLLFAGAIWDPARL